MISTRGRLAPCFVAVSIVGTLAMAYAPLLGWWLDRCTRSDSYYSHAFLILPMSLYWIHLKREEIHKGSCSDQRSYSVGLALLLFGALLYISGMRSDFPELAALSLPFVLSGVVGFLLGWRTLKACGGPLGFLFFMIPMPVFLLLHLSQWLKLYAVKGGLLLANMLGAEGSARGVSLVFKNDSELLVGDPCSGLRSLIAIGALGVFFAFAWARVKRRHRWILLLTALPLAFAGNVIRITVLCVTSAYGGGVAGWFHDMTGLVVYGVAMVAWLSMEGLFRRHYRGSESCAYSALP